MYDKFAAFYDNKSRTEFSLAVLETSQSLLSQHGISLPETLLDIACGTGVLSCGLSEAGWKVIAIDRSEAMLSIAQKRAKESSLFIDFRINDIREFQLENPVSAALCFGDVINHLLTLDDVKQLFKCVKAALKSGGLFVFDTNTLNTYQSRLWNLKKTKIKELNYTMTHSAGFNSETGEAFIETIMEEHSPNGTLRSKEILNEQYYMESALENCLKELGFVYIQKTPYNPLDLKPFAPEIHTFKTLWTCKTR